MMSQPAGHRPHDFIDSGHSPRRPQSAGEGAARADNAAGPDGIEFEVRRARTSDVKTIRRLVEPLAEDRILLGKDAVSYFEGLQEFKIVTAGPTRAVAGNGGGETVACGALHVLWEDLAEVRTVATDARWRGRGIGRRLIESLLADAADLGVRRVFCLTFEVSFFTGLGFTPIDGAPVEPDVYAELLRSHDEGVAEFLDLARVKPNTLGNTRMLKIL
ncbi:amino-acid N-acetyltransferase [Spelaeicoccus albus]|uniref:Amino-acid N-acetyltransferase n=1 Tax=Spelaeicoccus albus TaxID=1280376 RepID=A0A7Z0D5S9_9MICO|nr:amino-acid N-acetyltransferase [Spelaeicoccus albus]NYI69422.1 amino-acid N-acetyltransferase [Spelaeicoccus albus]